VNRLQGCGWHVDDKGFWPSRDDDSGLGINVWIALDKYRISHGGGLAVAPTSHRASFASSARKAISSGFGDTCRMRELSPENHEKLEALKVTYDMEPGDAIIHTRYCFHRSDDFTEEGKSHFYSDTESQSSPTKKALLRYSIRYMPADSFIADGKLSTYFGSLEFIIYIFILLDTIRVDGEATTRF